MGYTFQFNFTRPSHSTDLLTLSHRRCALPRRRPHRCHVSVRVAAASVWPLMDGRPKQKAYTNNKTFNYIGALCRLTGGKEGGDGR